MTDEVPDDVLARALQQMGAVTFDQVEAARASQEEEAKRGLRPSLAEVLLQQKAITPLLCENVSKKLLAQQQGGIKQLGPYKLLKKLGEGGMGAVYLAEDTQAGRRVAVKILPPKFAENREFLTRFRREAVATGKLNHVNIVMAYTVSEDMGVHYYVMEYCDGETLDDILKRSGAVRWDHAVGAMSQAARGLRHAHEHGILHRDIKPGNIFVCKPLGGKSSADDRGDPFVDGFVAKILDLGLSKTLGSSEASFTQTGVALGTPYYISPEQAKGAKEIDGRTDIYSLGATFYHVITGHEPFEGSSAAVVIMKHLNAQLTNPRDIKEGIPAGVVHVMRRMMAKDPRDRYANCDRLLEDLTLVMEGEEPASRPIDPMKTSVGKARRARAKAVGAGGHGESPGTARRGTSRHDPVGRPRHATAGAGGQGGSPAGARRGTRRHEPVGRPGHAQAAAGRADRRAAKAGPGQGQRVLLFGGGGIAFCLIVFLVVYILRPPAKPKPAMKKASQTKPADPVSLPPPTVPTAKKPADVTSGERAQREREADAKFAKLFDGLAPNDTAGRLARLEEFEETYHDTMVAARARVMAGQLIEKNLPPLVDAEGWLRPIRGRDLHGWRMLKGGAFDTHGAVTVKDGMMTLGKGQPITGVVWRGPFPATDFQLECEVRRGAPQAPWMVLFPLRGMPWAAALAQTEAVCGPVRMQGYQYRVGISSKWVPPGGLASGQWHRIRLRVQEPHIGLWINGEKRLDLDTTGIRAEEQEDPKRYLPMSICTLLGGGAVRDLRVGVLRPPLPPPDASGWIALFKGENLKSWSGVDVSHQNLGGSARVAGGLLDVQGPYVLRHALAAPDLTVRLRGSRQPKDGLSIGLRYSCDGTSGYAAFLNNRGEIGIVKTEDGRVDLLAGRQVVTKLQGVFEMAFSVAGNTLSVAVNGQEVVRVQDDSFTDGCIVLSVHPESRVRVHHVHVRLPGKPTAPARVE